MAKVVNSILIGIGLDFDGDGAKKAEAGVDSMRKKAIQLGAVVAGAFGVKKLTFDFANARDKLGKFSDVMGVLPGQVNAIGRSIEMSGGSYDDVFGTLSHLEDMRAGLLSGDAGFIGELGKAGISPGVIIGAKNATEAYTALGDQFARMNKKQRVNAKNALGFSDADIINLSRGSKALRSELTKINRIQPITKSSVKMAADFNDNLTKMDIRVDSIADKFSEKLVPAINKATGGMIKWYDANQSWINSGIDKVTGTIADNFALIATSAGLIAAAGVFKTAKGIGKIASGIGGLGGGGCCGGGIGGGVGGKAGGLKGIGKAGAMLTIAGPVTIAAATAYLASGPITDAVREKFPWLDKAIPKNVKITDLLPHEEDGKPRRGGDGDHRPLIKKGWDSLFGDDDSTAENKEDKKSKFLPVERSSPQDTQKSQFVPIERNAPSIPHAVKETQQSTSSQDDQKADRIASQAQQAEPQNITVMLNLDGDTLAKHVVKINERQNAETLRHFSSSVRS